jgi:hypothetical protein
VGDGFGFGEGEAFTGGDDAGFGETDGAGFGGGVGEAFGFGVGEGAASMLESGRQSARPKMKERNLMKNARWIGRSAGRCQRNAASPPNYDIEQGTARST